jgi:hypothetical protein
LAQIKFLVNGVKPANELDNRQQVHVFMSQSKQISGKKLLFTSGKFKGTVWPDWINLRVATLQRSILVMKRNKRETNEEKQRRRDGMGW